MNVGAEPFLFLLKYALQFDIFFTLFTHLWLPGYYKIFQIIALPIIIWPMYNLILYEVTRTGFLFFSATMNTGAKTLSIFHSLQEQIQRGVFLHKKYFLYYSRIRIISQSVDHAIKITLLLLITLLGLITCITTFVAIRFSDKYSVGMTVLDGINGIAFLLFLEVILRTFGRCDKMCRRFLRCCKNVEPLCGMSREKRRVYLKRVDSLPRLTLPVGVGQFRLIRLTKDSKANILFYLTGIIGNALITF